VVHVDYALVDAPLQKIYELIREGAFPRWADLPKIASGWVRSDIERWIESRTGLLTARMEKTSRRQATFAPCTNIWSITIANAITKVFATN